MRSSRILIGLSIFAASAITSLGVSAQGYPDKPVKIIVPSTPGGGADFLARLIAQKLTEKLGGSFVVENRPGGGQIVGTAAAARAVPDGYTLLMTYTDHVYAPHLRDSIPYDTIKDFKPVSSVGSLSFMLAVTPSFPGKNLTEFVAFAKGSPGTLTYASAGNGSSLHLSAELFNSAAGISTQHIPYTGSGPALTDLVSGRVQYIFASAVSLAGLVRDGKLRPIAFGGTSRDPALADVPTFAESGYPGFEAGIWYALLAPAGTPDPIITTLNTALVSIIAAPDVREKLAAQGVAPRSSTPAELGTKINTELVRWGKIIKDAKIKLQ